MMKGERCVDDRVEQLLRAEEVRKKWLKMWEGLGARIIRMPSWMQTIILEDVNTAIRNRVDTMEMIQQSKK